MSDDEAGPSKKSNLLEDEADQSGEEDPEEASYVDSSEEDDEEGEEGEDANNDGFFVDEDVEDNADEGAEARTEKRRKRRRSSVQQELDEEDIALLEENTGQTFKRGGQLKRLKKRAQLDDSRRDRSALEKRVLGDEIDAEYEDLEDEDKAAGADDVREHAHDLDPDDLGDFIVREHGQEADYLRYRESMRRQGQIGGISADAAQEIFELFGSREKTLEELLHEFDESQKLGAADAYEPDLDEDEYEDDDPEAAERRAAERAARRPAQEPVADPTILKQHYLTAEDDRVKEIDIPEREQLARAQLIPDDLDLAACGEWIYSQVFAPGAPRSLPKLVVEEGILEMDGLTADDIASRPGMLEGVSSGPDLNISSFRLLRRARQYGGGNAWMDVEEWQQDDAAQQALKASIHQVLRAVYTKHFEVPVVAMFCKENCGELLALREYDKPAVVDKEMCRRMEAETVFVAEGAVLAYCRRIRRWDALWAVYNASHQWLSLKKQKEAKKKQLDKASQRASQTDVQNRLADLEVDLESVHTHEDLEDWSANFRLLQQLLQADPERSGLEALSLGADGDGKPRALQHRPSRVSRYLGCVRAQLRGLADKLVLPAEQFAENVATITEQHPQGYTMYEVKDDKTKEPRQLAEMYAVPKTAFETAESCLQGAEHIIICELAAHPTVRATVRRLYRELATVSTEPTDAGELELDPFHVHGCVKRIRRKPVKVLEDSDQFLHMVTAEKKNLVKVTMTVDEKDFATRILEPFSMLYCSDDVHPVSEKLNGLRRGILQSLLEKHLLPQLERECRIHLLQQARQKVLESMSDSLWKLAIMPPLRLKCEEEDTDRFVANQRTMAVCYGPGASKDNPRGAATHMVMLDARGYPIDMLSLPQLSGAIPRSRKLNHADGADDIYDPSKDPRKEVDIARMQAFVQKHWPHVIVVGASSLECRQLLADIKKVTETFNQEDLIDHLEDTKTIDVRLVEETVAALCEESAFARDDLKEFPPIVRRAVALGRTVIDPLAVLCSLATSEREVLSLQLHPLQEFVPEDERWRAVEQVLVTVVAQVGAPINAMVHVDWLAQTLQFVPGLGPRKARALLKAVKQLEEPVLEDRENLLAHGADAAPDPDDPFAHCRVLQKVVYRNAAPYLRICHHEAIATLADRDFDVQNDMRVHPDDVDYLVKLARITLDEPPDEEVTPNPVSVAIHRKEDVMKLELSLFNDMIMSRQEASGTATSRMPTYLDLQMELMEPYGELRAKERPGMTEAEEFFALSGETPKSLQSGKLVQATVIWVGRELARLRLDNGLVGTVSIEDVSRNPPAHMSQALAVGREVTARVGDVDFTAFSVRLVTRSDTLAASEWFEEEHCQRLDPYYHVQTQEERNAALQQQRSKGPGRKAFIARPITYPLFQNVSTTSATSELQKPDSPDGRVIMRPCAKSTDRLSVSIRLFTTEDGTAIIQHLDIHEPPKGGAAGSHLRLATPLTIPTAHVRREDCTFEDLDEVYTRYLQPYLKCINEVKAHKKFVLLPLDQLDTALRQSAQGYDYRLGLKYDRPGLGFISWTSGRGHNVHHCYFTVSHLGYCLALKTMDGSSVTHSHERNVEKLIAAFKRHMTKVMKAQQSRTAAVPDHRQYQHQVYNMSHVHA